MRVRYLKWHRYDKLFYNPVKAPQCRYCGSRYILIGGAVLEWYTKTQTWEWMDGSVPNCGDCNKGSHEFEPVGQWMMFDNFFQLEDE